MGGQEISRIRQKTNKTTVLLGKICLKLGQRLDVSYKGRMKKGNKIDLNAEI